MKINALLYVYRQTPLSFHSLQQTNKEKFKIAKMFSFLDNDNRGVILERAHCIASLWQKKTYHRLKLHACDYFKSSRRKIRVVDIGSLEKIRSGKVEVVPGIFNKFSCATSTGLRSDPSSMGHVESRVNQQGPRNVPYWPKFRFRLLKIFGRRHC
nr:probable indole-3-pyruvate monooxygenase YUCCA8 [Solanum lycopersicum]